MKSGRTKLFLGMASGGWIFLFFWWILFSAFSRAVSLVDYCGPITYGEGIVTWMSWKLGRWEWPYGDIRSVPSLYSCYGFLPSAAALLISGLLAPGSLNCQGGELLYSGRILTVISWAAGAVFLGAIRQPSIWQRVMAAGLPISLFSSGVFMYSWRIDPFLCAVLSGTMLLASGPRVWDSKYGPWFLCALAAMVTLTKPVALVEFSYFLAIGFLLSGRSGWKPALLRSTVGIASGVASVILADWLSSGWMLNNTVSVQALSGWKSLAGTWDGLHRFSLVPAFPLFAVLFLVFLVRGDGKMAFVLWAAAAWSLAVHCKHGGAENYFIPLCCAASPLLARMAGNLPPVKAIVCFAGLALAVTGGWGDRMKFGWAAIGPEQVSNAGELVLMCRGGTVLSEDCLFPAMAGVEPLVTDVFQLGCVQAAKGGDISAWLEKSKGGVIAGGRVLALCGKSGNEGLSLDIGSTESYAFYTNFRCSWSEKGLTTNPFPTVLPVFFVTCLVGLIGLALRRTLA